MKSVVFINILLFLPTLYISAQINFCDGVFMDKRDSTTGEKIIQSQKPIVISDDGGKTGFAIFAATIDSTFILSIQTVGAGPCVDTGDPIHFIFADSSRLELNNMRDYNCERKSSIYFAERFGNPEVYQTLSTKRLAKLSIWTKQKVLTRNVGAQEAAALRNVLECFRTIVVYIVFPRSSTVYKSPEHQPEFPGGPRAMTNFMRANLKYPAEARKKNIEGTVYVSFVINVDGSITNVIAIERIHPVLDAEAERVVNLMPPWVPGRRDGKPIPVRFVLPFKFGKHMRLETH